jgi:hypothetical protein
VFGVCGHAVELDSSANRRDPCQAAGFMGKVAQESRDVPAGDNALNRSQAGTQFMSNMFAHPTKMSHTYYGRTTRREKCVRNQSETLGDARKSK